MGKTQKYIVTLMHIAYLNRLNRRSIHLVFHGVSQYFFFYIKTQLFPINFFMSSEHTNTQKHKPTNKYIDRKTFI